MINGVLLLAYISLLGIFISINGISTDSVQSLTTGKALNTILIDGGDLVLIIKNIYTVKEMLNSKIKAARTMGRIYADPIDMSDKNT